MRKPGLAGNPAPEGAANDRPPQRLVCGSPAVAEIVFALRRGDRVVAVSDHTIYPPEAAARPHVGGILNPNRERLLALNPDALITQGRHEPLAQFASAYGIAFHAVRLDTLQDIFDAVETIAAVLDVKPRGQELNADIRRAFDEIRERHSAAQPRRVLLLFGRMPGDWNALATIGPGSFLHDLIALAGGTNVFADALGAYPQISKEALLIRQPEVILELHPGGLRQDARARLRADWAAFPSLPAVRDNRIHFLTQDFLLIPGPRAAQIARAFADAIHSEAPHE